MRNAKLWSFIFWLVIGIFAIVPTGYFFARIADKEFRDSAMGNWFATMVGAIVGILIALEINRRQQEVQEKKEQEDKRQERLTRKTKILNQVKRELESNRQGLADRLPIEDGVARRVVPVDRLKDELWNALSDGGELQWIDDLDLLDCIATAYYNIRLIIYLEEKYVDHLFFPGERRPKDRSKQEITEKLMAYDNQAREHIGRALTAIENSLAAA